MADPADKAAESYDDDDDDDQTVDKKSPYEKNIAHDGGSGVGRSRRNGWARKLLISPLSLVLVSSALLMAFPAVAAAAAAAEQDAAIISPKRQLQQEADANDQCAIPPLPAPPSYNPSRPYQIGVLAIRGIDAAYNEFNATFTTYLTLSAGRQFDPPVQFENRPMNFLTLFEDVQSDPPAVDFIYVNPSAYSCIESEFSAHSLASQISKRTVGDETYDLTKFGGVIAVREESNIYDLDDIRGKIVAAASISGLGSGQMQFRELEKAGLSYINDPKQLVFTSNQGKVVNGLLDGKFDVAFVRTDQIERTKNSTGDLVDKDRIRIINPQPDLQIDGVPFPFTSSTPLYPEWNVASLGHVGDEVASEVQKAMRALASHADVGYDILSCYDVCNFLLIDGEGGGETIQTPTEVEEVETCKASCRDDADLTAGGRCDTTVELALAAAEAKTNGKYTGWRSTLSYMELRNMQEETNFIRKDEASGTMQCVRSKNIYEAVVCPPGHFRRKEEEVLNGCEAASLPCTEYDEAFQCLCRPCVKSFDVDIVPIGESDSSIAVASSDFGVDERDSPIGCAKMSLCGVTQQTKPIRYRAIDNKARPNLDLVVYVHAGQSLSREIRATPVRSPANETEETYMYEFEIIEPRVGVVVLEIFADEEQIPESPVRLEIARRDCAADNEDPLSVAEADGTCVCDGSAVSIGGNCVQYSVLLSAIIIPIVFILSVLATFYLKRKHQAADSVWHVKEKELTFDNPPEIIGRGTFGLVLLAEYRGTKVAVKRVIPPKAKRSNGHDSASGHGSGLGNGMESGMASGSTSIESRKTRKRYSFIIPKRDSSGGRSSGLIAIEEESLRRKSSSSRRGSGASSSSFISDIFQRKGSSDGRRASHGDAMLSLSTEDGLEDEKKEGSKRIGPTNDENGTSRVRRVSFPDTMQSVEKMGRRLSIEENDSIEKEKRQVAYKTFDADAGDAELGLANVPTTGATNSGVYSASEGRSSGQLVQSSSDGFTSSQLRSLSGSGQVDKRNSSSTGSTTKSNWFLRTIGWNSNDEYAKLKADFIVEMRHLSKLRHPCITTVMGAVIEKGVEPMLIMEYMDMGSLHDILHNESFPLDGDLLLPILCDIAQGVRFLHAAKPQVIHGDLKAHNVLVDSNFRAKVADFGLSAKKVIGATGTPLWMAPELLRGESSNTAASDCYSFGIILYEVYSRKDPYEGENIAAVLKEVMDPKVNKRPPVPPACPVQIASIMADCLSGDPGSRPAVEEVDLRLKRLSVENVEPGEMHLSYQARKHLKAKRGEDLIEQMFPKHIADQLRQGRKPGAENKEMVTVFFSDVVGFTDLSTKLADEKVSDMLDRLYQRFDDLASKHDVFKIETIGDAFIGVTNLVKDQNDDHAKRIAAFAIDCVEAASKTPVSLDDPSLGPVRIRVGFNSGPVIATVVGSRLPKYTILGDTVNSAARMESNSLPGKIQCSERSARLVAKQDPAITIVPRGEISIKGKGTMETFWVDSSS